VISNLSHVDAERIQLSLAEWSRDPTFAQRHVIQAPRPETRPKVPKTWRNHARNRESNVRPCLIEDKNLDASPRCQFATGDDILAEVVRREIIKILETAWC
jgi:hypothetical protein